MEVLSALECRNRQYGSAAPNTSQMHPHDTLTFLH
jgi:hypothetical protein